MKAYKQKTWQIVVNGGIDGNTELFGVNIFDYEWVSTGRRTTLVLSNGRNLISDIFQVNIDGEINEFAAGEVSMAVWIFAVYKY